MAEEKQDGWYLGKNLTPNEDGSWYLGKNLDKFGQRITGREEPRRYSFSDFASLIPGNRIVSYLYDVLRDDPNDPDDYYLGKVMDKMVQKNREERQQDIRNQAQAQHDKGHYKQSGSERAAEEFQALQDKASRQDAATGGEIKRTPYDEGGELDDQMGALMGAEETHTMPDGTVMPGATHEEYEEQEMLPDEEMEEDYVDYVVNSTLEEQDKNYLESALAEDAKLSEIFDQVVESATEFSGSGPIEGPGSEMSDSIPARLSDGEFVFTAKAVEEIGVDNLQQMMEDAETIADERQPVAYGGMIDEEDQAVPLPTQGSRAALGNVPNVVKQSRQVEEEMLKSSPRRYYVPVSG